MTVTYSMPWGVPSFEEHIGAANQLSNQLAQMVAGISGFTQQDAAYTERATQIALECLFVFSLVK